MTKQQLKKLYKVLSDYYDDLVSQSFSDTRQIKKVDDLISLVSKELNETK